MRDKFCLLSNPCSLFLTDNIKLDGIPTEIKSNLNICFTFFQVLIEINPVNISKTQLPVFFISYCFISILTAAIIFYDFLEFHSTLI